MPSLLRKSLSVSFPVSSSGVAAVSVPSRAAWLACLLAAGALAPTACADLEEDAAVVETDPPVDDGEVIVQAGEPSLAASQPDAAPSAACTVAVTPASQLMITALPVVNDPVRTKWTGSVTSASDGAWHFGRLMTQMAGANDPTTFVRSWLAQWESTVGVNGWGVPARPAIASQVLASWPKTAAGKLDLTKAPMRLLAIVNRFDLRSAGNAGEGRFIFGVLGQGGVALPFTVILEYKLPAASAAEVKAWAHLWRDLGATTVGSAAYRAQLQAITDKFARKGAAPGRINGSAISQVRTNENALNPIWELREFRLTTAGQLRMVAPALTPADSTPNFNNTATLASFMNQNAAAIKAQTHTVPTTFGGALFSSGRVLNRIDFWNAPGITDSTLRHRFSINTCDGCHGEETATPFLHVSPRGATETAPLSAFLTGTTVPDPVTGILDPSTFRTFNELASRATVLKTFLCANP